MNISRYADELDREQSTPTKELRHVLVGQFIQALPACFNHPSITKKLFHQYAFEEAHPRGIVVFKEDELVKVLWFRSKGTELLTYNDPSNRVVEIESVTMEINLRAPNFCR